MKYYLIAGEASGDLHGSNLIKGLREADAEASFRFWGGDLMAEAAGGTEPVRHYRDTAVMGVFDVLTHLPRIVSNFAACHADIRRWNPDVVVLIDYPGFNLPIAKWAKRHGFRVFYYISPKVWASKEYRVRSMRRYIDKLFTIFPFETEWLMKRGIEPFYCGNPVTDAIAAASNPDDRPELFAARHGLNEKPKIALLAGSRRSEIKYVLPEMMRMIPHYPHYEFVIAGAPSFTEADYEPYLQGRKIPIVFGRTYELLAASRAAIVTSGTATLETALLGCPQVVVYLMWGGGFSHWVARKLIKVPYISLVNLILGRQCVCELFQKDYTFERLRHEFELVAGTTRERTVMLEQYEQLKKLVGGPGCSRRAADEMVRLLRLWNGGPHPAGNQTDKA